MRYILELCVHCIVCNNWTSEIKFFVAQLLIMAIGMSELGIWLQIFSVFSCHVYFPVQSSHTPDKCQALHMLFIQHKLEQIHVQLSGLFKTVGIRLLIVLLGKLEGSFCFLLCMTKQKPKQTKKKNYPSHEKQNANPLSKLVIKWLICHAGIQACSKNFWGFTLFSDC